MLNPAESTYVIGQFGTSKAFIILQTNFLIKYKFQYRKTVKLMLGKVRRIGQRT